MVAAPASRSSVRGRSWNVPAVRSTRPFAWGDSANINCIRGSAELGGRAGGLVFGAVFEDRTAVGVEGQGNATALYQALQPQEVAAAVFLIAEESVDHGASGIINGEEQRELRPVLAQPAVMTAVQLYQNSLPGPALTTYPVLGLASSSWTVQTGVDQDASQGGPADVDALAFAGQLCQMRVVGSLVNRAGQVNYPAPDRLGNSVGRLAATGAGERPMRLQMPWRTMWFIWLAPGTQGPTTPISASCSEIGKASTWPGPPYDAS